MCFGSRMSCSLEDQVEDDPEPDGDVADTYSAQGWRQFREKF